MDLISLTPSGLYCAAGAFHIDPWQPVERAVITHAHSDHASAGHTHYLAAKAGVHVLRSRLGDVPLQLLEYGERLRIGDVDLSLHPAGHILGSAQVRIEHRGEVWVVSGDYKVEPDPTCAPFETVTCHTFVTESTFGLPIYRWRPQAQIFSDINEWWRSNGAAGRASVLYAYPLGKAQRVLAGVDSAIGPLLCHGAVEALNAAYRESGVKLPPTQLVVDQPRGYDYSRALVIATPSAQSAPWLRRFGDYSDAFASGWMQIRGIRRRRAFDRGFALSDHADWAALNQAIRATGAERVFVTHGYVAPMVRWLQAQGLDARYFETPYTGEREETDAAPGEPANLKRHRREA
jgi:putative mRNA 3-end processing factor